MKTITIELLNEHALKLLKEMEDLKLLRLVDVQKRSSKKKWSGSISKETAEKLDAFVKKSRDEWN